MSNFCLTEYACGIIISADSSVWGQKVFLHPLGKDDRSVSFLISEVVCFCRSQGIKPVFLNITDDDIKYYRMAGFAVTERRDMADYIYLTSKLESLSGSAYHGKRNHITRFYSNYSYEFQDYEDDDFHAVMSLQNEWGRQKGFDDLEENALELWLKNRKEYGVKVCCLFADDKLIGCTVGGIAANNMAIIIYEKCDYNYDGAFAVINNLFVAKHFTKVKYINRQEDMGIDGLRMNKLSYHPEKIIMKYDVIC